MSLIIPAELCARIFRQLREAYPNEGGGFLLGTTQDGTTTIHDVKAITNVAADEEQFHRYAMTPLDIEQADDEASARGLALVGYYHSHPDWPPIPSAYDLAYANAWGSFCYLITSVQQGQPANMRAWRLTEDYSQFEELAVRISK